MNPPSSLVERLMPLVIAQLEGDISPEGMGEIESLICQNEESRRLYVRLIRESVGLRFWGGAAVSPAPRAEANREHAEISTPPLAPTSPPVLGFLSTTIRGTVGFFSSDWPLAYLVATVVMGVAVLIGSLVHVSQPQQIATRVGWDKRSDVPPSQGGHAPLDERLPASPTVGRVTGMVDCQWEEGSGSKVRGSKISKSPNLQTSKSLVSLGDTFALASGLMEITYDTGAKVILQGPVTYEVESPAGGYLSVGKLTARLDKKVASGQWPVASKSEIRNQKSEISNPQSPIPNPLFAVRTPTATVTDLGTEFGVEVDNRGRTTSHVFRGLVRVQMMAVDGKVQGTGQVLRENESARVDGSQDQRKIVVVSTAKTADFIRKIPKQTIKTFDLVDVVAGGDGFSGRRNRGIDPTTGQVSKTQPSSPNFKGDHRYHRVKGLPFVDGVFIPDGSLGPVQVDSSGNTYDDFFKTSNVGYGLIWAGAAIPGAGPSVLDGVDYSSPGHSGLFLHANKAITFDLGAIRRANPGCKLLRFCASAGSTDAAESGGDCRDMRVLIDGQLRFCRRQISRIHGAFKITIPIDGKDRFLTLAATDGGDGINGDSILFGDPRIELLAVEPRRDPCTTKVATES